MPKITDITDLSGIIRKATEKAQKAESSKYDDEIIRSQLNAAEERIRSAENQVEKYEAEKASIQDKLSPPPTKEIQGQGKKGNGTKKVVDEREVDRLNGELRATDVQLSQASKAVETARSEAQEFRMEALERAGVSQEHQQGMLAILGQLAELQTVAADEQTDLTGDSFKNQLNKAVEDTTKLAEEMPDIGAAVVQEFWGDVADGFKDINDSMIDYITPDPAEVKSRNNYEGYFEDISQGYNSIVNHLEGLGADRAVLASVNNSKDSILNEKNTYLGGMTEGDELILQEHLTDINVIVDMINSGEALTNDDLAKLESGAEETSGILAIGGSAFESVLEIPFNTIALNTNELSERIDDQQFGEFFGQLKNLYEHPLNNISDMIGITADEVNEIYDYSSFVTQLKNKDTISETELQKLLDDGNKFIRTLEDNYGFTTDDPQTYQNNGGQDSRGNSRVGVGSNRRY